MYIYISLKLGIFDQKRPLLSNMISNRRTPYHPMSNARLPKMYNFIFHNDVYDHNNRIQNNKNKVTYYGEL